MTTTKEVSTYLSSPHRVQELTILGIDPGSRFVGWGAIRLRHSKVVYLAHGVIAPRGDLFQRLHTIGEELRVIFQAHCPQVTAVEKVFLGKSVESAFVLGHARGVCLAEVARAQSELVEVAARTVKKAVTGHGGASKEQVHRMVEAQLGVKILDREDATDALAMALYGSQIWQQRERMATMGVIL